MSRTIRLSTYGFAATAIGLLLGTLGVADRTHAASGPTTRATAARATAAVISPATQHASTTARDYYRDLLSFNRRTLADVYRQVGWRNPKWDAAALAYLERTALHFAASAAADNFGVAETPTREELVAEGRSVREAGCNDPLVRYLHAGLTQDEGVGVELLPDMKVVAEAMLADARYPRYRALNAVRRVAALETDPAQADAWRQKFLAGLPPLCVKRNDDAERRLMLDFAWHQLNGLAEQQAFVDAMRAMPDADPWSCDVAAGRLEVLLGWKVRGGGFAGTVNAAGWRGLKEHMTRARDALTRAWQLAPHLPEAPTQLIAVAMAGHAAPGDTPETWFGRALEAQVDYEDAYKEFRGAILPRWGGSYEQMLLLAQACVENPRYDTAIPFQYVFTIQHVGFDQERSWSLLSERDVYDKVIEVCDRMADAAKASRIAAFYRSIGAAAAWRTGRWADARKTLDAVTAAGGKPSVSAFAFLNADHPAGTISEVYARTGPHSEALAAAEALLEGATPDQKTALAALTAVTGQLTKGDPAKPYVESRRREVEANVKFEAGEWASMQWDGSLSNWEKLEGEWIAEADGTLVGRAKPLPPKNDAPGASPAPAPKSLMWAGRDPGPAFEVAGRVWFPPSRLQTTFRTGGLVIQDVESKHRGWAVLEPIDHNAGFVLADIKTGGRTALGDGSEFRVRVDANTFMLWVDGQPVDMPMPRPEPYGKEIRIGIGGMEGTPVRFTDLRMRKAQPMLPESLVPAIRASAGAEPGNVDAVLSPLLTWDEERSPTAIAIAVAVVAVASAGVVGMVRWAIRRRGRSAVG